MRAEARRVLFRHFRAYEAGFANRCALTRVPPLFPTLERPPGDLRAFAIVPGRAPPEIFIA